MSSLNLQSERVTILRPEDHGSGAVENNTAVPPRLLIVDDISDNRIILLRRFQRHGFEVVEADSGLKALELIDRQEFDLVLLDVMMPGIDGIETLKRIRSRKSASVLPVIMVTAKSESENIVELLDWSKRLRHQARRLCRRAGARQHPDRAQAGGTASGGSQRGAIQGE